MANTKSNKNVQTSNQKENNGKGLHPAVIVLIVVGAIFLLIIAVIIVIGAFAYVYVSGPSLPSSEGAVSAPFYLSSWSADTGGVELTLVNKGPEAILIRSVSVTNCGVNNYGGYIKINSSETKVVSVNCDLITGDSFQGDISIRYTIEDSVRLQASSGNIKTIIA